MYKHLFKRLLDFFIALFALILISPILLVVTIWLHFANKGAGAFFLQERPGKNGKIFKVIKFKSMTDERDSNGNLLPDAQRLTKVGRFVRSTSIDELPQLINVLKGDMAFIGPRPLLVKYLPYYNEREQARHSVRPGMTGWAQIHGRNHLLWEQRFEYDVYYAEHLTLWLDIKIIFTTIKNVLQRKDIEAAPNLLDFDEYRRQQQAGRKFMAIDDALIDNQPIKVVRDDLFPDVGGGGKSRKTMYYETYLKTNGYNAVVTCGGIQSNHNRAIAMMCARNGWKCHLCIQGSGKRFFSEKGNALIDRLSGAECELICLEETAEAMERAMEQLRKEGYKPYYCHGGGHDLPGGIAFVDAVAELAKQTEKPDYIFHASGTGSTQAGIVVGLDRVGWSDVKCIGISVARQQERGRQVIVDFANMLAEYYGMKQRYDERILFNTDYLCGGYEQYTPEMEEFLNRAMRRTGLMFDTTYSGKAFYGMMDYVEKNRLQDKKIIFWHTGGLMNIMK